MNKKTVGMFIATALSLLLTLRVTTSAKITKPIKLNKKLITLVEGKKAKLNVTTRTNTKWKSNNKKVATVKKGVVTAKRVGKAKIMAYKGSRKAVCNVIVSKSNRVQSPIQTDNPTPNLEPIPSTSPILQEPTSPEPTPELTQMPMPSKPTSPEPTPSEPTSPEPTPSWPLPPLEDDFVPGVVRIGFYEPYLASLTELFPELDIAEIEDSNKRLYDSCKDNPITPKKMKESIRKRFGTTFTIKLTQETKESVLEAIDVIMKNPLVKHAVPNYITYPTSIETDGLIE